MSASWSGARRPPHCSDALPPMMWAPRPWRLPRRCGSPPDRSSSLMADTARSIDPEAQSMEGVVPFPAGFAQRYRDKGYWDDRPLRAAFKEWCERYGDKVALCDAKHQVSFRDLDARSTNLALNLLDLGIKPQDRLVVQLPNVIEFVYLHFALQQIGAIPVMALPPHRFREMSFFVATSEAVATVTPDLHRDFSYVEMVDRIRLASPLLRHCIVFGNAPPGCISLNELIERPALRSASDLDTITVDAELPALFLLSGGTTGIPKLIPRTHNDYAFNTRIAVSVCDIRKDSVLLDVLPIGHNLPLACPGLQGFLSQGCAVVLHTSAAPDEVFPLIDRYAVTHIQVVPALLIRWSESPHMSTHDLGSVRVIQSGGQRLQPEVRRRTESALRNCRVQENFGMAEGLLMFVRLDDPQ